MKSQMLTGNALLCGTKTVNGRASKAGLVWRSGTIYLCRGTIRGDHIADSGVVSCDREGVLYIFSPTKYAGRKAINIY